METGIGASADSSPNLPLLVHDGEPNVPDGARLNQLGYKQELSRSLSYGDCKFFGDVLHHIGAHGAHHDVRYRIGLRWARYDCVRMAHRGRFNHDGGSGDGGDLFCLSYFRRPIFWSAMLCGNVWGPMASWFTCW
ncbi:hypothetical protein F3Y22_tig00110279pilonHSYRG00209 [Hibiscus syriacus]|uniref:Uncharacterized protein n=1 Tax=Hibiscus syriacus TaxID=106335 RepID=A0A6A3B7Q1_HIBSY|nr:hypothetical protein F3Y22_tig00110279pilonHSYRG00209 [Hibiscus syriacus]